MADHVFKAVAELSPEESTFKRLKERLSKSYRNLLNHHKASQQALSLFHQTCMAKYYTTQERLAVLEGEVPSMILVLAHFIQLIVKRSSDISLEELLSFGAGLIHRSYVEIFLHGHSKPEVRDPSSLVSKALTVLNAYRTSWTYTTVSCPTIHLGQLLIPPELRTTCCRLLSTASSGILIQMSDNSKVAA